MNTELECSGTCDGLCSTPSTGPCDAICLGNCDGACSQKDEGECVGFCSGNCNGECVEFGQAACAEACEGGCFVEGTPEAECATGLVCSEICDGDCDGSCHGKVVPPSCCVVNDCDMTAACLVVSSLIGYAYADCEESWLEVFYQLELSLDQEAVSEFNSTMESIEEAMSSIIDGYYLLSFLMNSQSTAEPGLDP